MTDSEFARFIEKIEIGDGCWPWTAAQNGVGYGVMKAGGRMTYAHRLSYEHFIGPIPPGLDIDHLCRVRNRVKPQHLEPVTRGENIRRGESPRAVANRTNTCKRGHSLADAYIKAGGRRSCRRCDCEQQRLRRADRKALLC